MGPAADLRPAAAPAPSCPAAQGVAGDVLLCADFSQIDALDHPKLANWNFTVGSIRDCWRIVDHALSNQNLDQGGTDCAVSLPAIDWNDRTAGGYSRLVLSMVYKLELASAQTVDVAVTNNDLVPRLFLGTWVGSDLLFQNVLTQSIYSIEKGQMPARLFGTFKPYVRIVTSGARTGGAGWQMGSLAVLGVR